MAPVMSEVPTKRKADINSPSSFEMELQRIHNDSKNGTFFYFLLF